MESLSRGMTRPDLCCIWEIGCRKARMEAERLVRKLRVT